MYYYRPQRSYGKVMFSQASVILFTAGCLPDTPRQTPPTWADTPEADTPPGQTPPSGQISPSRHIPFADTPLGRHTPFVDTPYADTPLGRHTHLPPGRTSPSQQTATAADGTHHTGMHSCFLLSLNNILTKMYFGELFLYLPSRWIMTYRPC